ncbi:MAG: NnrU protein [Betaproteobacteria bacterium]|nr:NnrU protein [Betaproteobacteria bacterium]
MDPIAHLSLATAVFVATHFVPSTPLRAALAGKIGERAYLGLYIAVALATLVWMVNAYSRAPIEPLWPGLRLLPVIVMPFAFILLVCGVLSRNPTAVGQEKALKSEEAARGILRVTRHPVQWGILLWALAHLLARGDLKSAIFFGGFFLLSALGTLLIDARKARAPGEDWRRYAGATSNVPLVAIAQGRNTFRAGEIGLVKPVIGLILYGGFLLYHAWLFGAEPY